MCYIHYSMQCTATTVHVPATRILPTRPYTKYSNSRDLWKRSTLQAGKKIDCKLRLGQGKLIDSHFSTSQWTPFVAGPYVPIRSTPAPYIVTWQEH